MKFTLLDAHDPRWKRLAHGLETDVYHLPEYAVAAKTHHRDEVRAAWVTGDGADLLLPLHLRELPQKLGHGRDLVDAVSPYGYPGPALTTLPRADEDAFLTEAIPALLNGLADNGVVSTFVRVNPLVGPRASLLADYGEVVHHGATVVVDLSKDEDTLWSETRKGYRYDIRRALRNGQKAYPDAEWTHLREFVDIYAETMTRLDAAEFYAFPETYFTALQHTLPDNVHLWVVEIDDTIAAGALFTEANGIVQYHLSGTRSTFLRDHPTKTLLHSVRTWAKNRGNHWLHLGGGLGADADSLFHFKAGFSKETRQYHTWRIINRPEDYDRLTAEASTQASASAPDDDFFPLYRRTTK